MRGEKGEECRALQECRDSELTADEFSRITETLQKNLSSQLLLQHECTVGLFPATAASYCKEIFDCNPDSSDGYYWKSANPPELMCCKPKLGLSESTAASSCQEIFDCNPDIHGGYYRENINSQDSMYCMKSCNNVAGMWRRVALVNMANSSEICLRAGLRTITSPKRICTGASQGCTSVSFSTRGINYNAVCGRAIGYQFGSPDGIDKNRGFTIDRNYVDGLSITYGPTRNRHHIWTYAVGHTGHCLCQPNSVASQPPSFVGQHYYCDGHDIDHRWHPDDPLWDKTGRLSHRQHLL